MKGGAKRHLTTATSKRVSSGKKKAYTALLQCRTFLCRKKMGSTEERFRWWIWFPGFYRVFVSTTGLESFSFRSESSPKDFLSVVVVYAFFFSVLRTKLRAKAGKK